MAEEQFADSKNISSPLLLYSSGTSYYLVHLSIKVILQNAISISITSL